MENDRQYTRKNQRRVKSIHPMDAVSPYIMVTRNDASNLFSDSLDADPIDAYIRKKRQEGLTNFGFQHVLLAAYVRAVAEYPGINRFIRGQKVFTRDRIVVNMSVKKNMAIDGQSTIIKVVLKPSDTAEDVYRAFQEVYADAVRPSDTSFDNTAKIINYIPGLVKKFVIWLLKLLDYFGWLPTALTNVSPFHGSLFITSMGSLGIRPVYHHLYNFGHIPAFISFGLKRHANEVDVLGNPVRRNYYDLAIVTDERICDGFYFATAFKAVKRTLRQPDILDTVPTVTPDIP